MAKCNWCHMEMLDEHTYGCNANDSVEFPDGGELPSIPYERDRESRCHDCNVAPGNFHHPGCDMEICPRCGGQLISCGCLDAPKTEQSDEGDAEEFPF